MAQVVPPVVFDFAVVGAGVFGSWIARTLHQAGQRVILLDQYGPANNRASSGGESRIIRMGYGDREIYTQFSWRSLELYKDFYAKIDPTLFHETGFLWMARPGDTFTESNIPVFDRLKIPYERLDAAELRRRYPQIELGPVTWGLYEPRAGGLMARRGVQAVVRESVKQGLAYRQGAVVSRERTKLKMENGETINAGTVIYACGPWLRKLFPEVLEKKIQPTRQEVFYFGAPADGLFGPAKMPAWIDAGDTIYGLPDLENRGFKLAPDRHGVTVDPDTQERLVPAASVLRVRAYLKRRFPRLAAAPLTQTEVCQYENTANGDYLIDRHPGEKNVWLVGGGSGHGYKHGPALGEYVAGILLKKKDIDPRFLLAAKPDIVVGGRSSTVPPPVVKKLLDR